MLYIEINQANYILTIHLFIKYDSKLNTNKPLTWTAICI